MNPVPGIVSMVVIMQSLMSGMSVVWDREFGFLKEVQEGIEDPADIVDDLGQALRLSQKA